MSGNGSITELDPDDREDPIDLQGEDLDGNPVDLLSMRGKVVVVNVWGSWCPPCRQEAPALADVADRMTGKDVAFLGIAIREKSQADSEAFVRSFDIPFPSIYDPTGIALLAFNGDVPPQAIPSTLVLDREGRIAARVLGPIPTATTLRSMIEKVVAEDA